MTVAVIGSVILAVIGYLTQIAVFPALGATSIGPNMIISLTVVFAMVYGAWPALAMGFFGGIMVDLMAGGAIAISSFVPILVGFTLSIFKEELNSHHFVWAMVFAVLAHLLNDFWIMSALYFGRITLNINFGTFFRSLLSALETGLFAGIIFIIITKLVTIGERRSSLPYLQRY